MSFWDNLLDTVTDFIQETAPAVTDFIQDTAAAVTDFIQDTAPAVTDFIQDTAPAVTDFIQDTAAAVTDFIQDTAPAVTDFLESVGTLTYGNYGGLNYSAGVVGGTITETSPPPVDAYDAAFYLHDLAYQSSSDPAVRLPADVQLAESLIDLEQQGGGSVNVQTGGDGVDIQVGGEGVDWIYGGLGNDQQNGGAGTDGVFGGAGNDILVLGAGHDAGWGGADDDNISGGAGNDFLFGGAGYDYLYGEAGNDWLDGGGAQDTCDYLIGGIGADNFVVHNLPGCNVIEDFNRAEGDQIRLQDTGLNSFADVLSHTYDYDSFSIISIDTDTSIYLLGQTSATFQATDFAFC
jgi:RTX calcium-binding nonapeptide repeat (4 copies)